VPPSEPASCPLSVALSVPLTYGFRYAFEEKTLVPVGRLPGAGRDRSQV